MRGDLRPEMTGESRLHFAVLGSFRVCRDGVEIDLGPRLQRMLLAILVVEAGHVVPVDRLIDLLWREPPTAAIASVQAYVSQLRRVLEPGRPARGPARVLVTQDPGYVLRTGDDQVDALRFLALARRAHGDLEEGQPAAAAAWLEEALALWRGDPLAEFVGEPWAVAAAARLMEAHDLAIEDRVEAWLALGGHAQAAAELEAMVAARPLRERRWGQLIVAAYRCGRQADALHAYQRCRTVLAGELGLEPGPGLRRLEAAVLAQDPSLDWHPAAGAGAAVTPAVPGHAEAKPPRPQPAVGPSAPSLVGRDPELAHLRDRLQGVRSGHGGAVVLAGEPGAGKTTLAEAAARLAAAAGVTAAWGRCLDAATTPAYWPWSQVLGALPDGPAVRAARQRLDGDLGGEEDDSVRQFRAYQAVAAALGGAATDAPVLAVIDDLHAADDASLALLQLLAGDLHRMPALLVVTVRDTEPSPALGRVLGELLRHPGAERVAVSAFEATDVAVLVERLTAEPPQDGVVAALMRRTGGNPFYTTELVRLITGEHRRQPLTADAVQAHEVPSGIRDVLLRRAGRLPEDTQSLLTLAAAAGRDLQPELLERVTGLAAPSRAVPGASAAPGRALPGDIASVAETDVIRTPDQRVRVFVSSSLTDLAAERRAVRDAVRRLRLVPVMFELGARPHPPQPVYRAYLAQSQVFVGIYWQSYGWVAPGEGVSGLEDEYLLSAGLPRLIYVKSPAPDREPQLAQMLARIEEDGRVSYQLFSDPAELQRLVEDDLAVLLSERFEMARSGEATARDAPLAGVVPVPVTPLVGREPEAAALEDLVVREGARLVTLTGAGGVGKSRLAVEAARRLGPGFADGVRFVELAAVPAADLVAPAVAAGLGLTSSADRLIADLKAFLRNRRLLLVLDNFEHVIGASALLAGLLAAAPGVVVLVTSRVVLRLRGEHEFQVSPLPVPPAGTGQDAGDVQDYASVGLFAQRARAAAAGFELTGGNAEAVAEICRRLDGLPLAIELAAARVRLLPPQALALRLGERFSLLTGGARDLPERQRTLRNTLDWSFGLLSAGEQALLARLGVFAGPFGLSAAEAVGGQASDAVPDLDHTGPVMDTLGSLVDSSLIWLETRGGEPRFGLLETVREYALEHLAGGGDWAEAHDRHAAYFVALAEPAEAELQGPGQLAWLDRLETEHDNVRAAMSWLVDQGPLEQAISLLSLTWRFWWLHGHAAEFARLGEEIVAKSQRLPPYQRALALTGTGFMLIANGDAARAQALFEQSLPLYRPLTRKLGVLLTAAVLGMLGRLAGLRGDTSGACQLLDQSQALLRELDDDFDGYARVQYLLFSAMVDNFLGEVRLSQGDHDRAARQFTDGLTVGRRAQDRISILPSLYYLALSSEAQGDLVAAAGHLKEGLALAAGAGDETSAAYYLEGLAAVATQQDNPQRAVRLFAAARSLLEARGSGWLHAFVPRVSHDDAVLAALRSRIGDAAFEEAQAWGGSVKSTRAVQYALE